MFEWLAKFDKILVTGPQRSGTRIGAQMIAYDTAHEYIDENDLYMDSLYMLCSFLQNRQRLVIHCPVLCRYTHIFSADNTAIVLMRRDVEDIVASQKRIGWSWEWLELARYDHSDGVIAEVKYRFWEEHQREHIKHAFEIEYESLAAHPLWVPEHLRQGFEAAQTVPRAEDWALSPDARLCHPPDILYWEQPDQSAAILTRRGPAKLLNATGRLIWTLCDGTRTRQDILQALEGCFEGAEQDVLSRDMDDFINSLLTHGFLRLCFSGDVAGTNAT